MPALEVSTVQGQNVLAMHEIVSGAKNSLTWVPVLAYDAVITLAAQSLHAHATLAQATTMM